MEENNEALELYVSVRTQWRGAGMGIIGLDYVALHQAARRLEIDLSPCVMAKISALEAHELERMRPKAA